jgi:hypothetical protein
LCIFKEQNSLKPLSKKAKLVNKIIGHLQEYDINSVWISQLKNFPTLHSFMKYLKILKKYIKAGKRKSYYLASLKLKNKLILELSEQEIKMIVPRKIRNASIVLDKQK